jgi:hypothetical protein
MMPSGIEKRIFLVGAPRSGTTLVQSLLAAHSAVHSFTESHFFSRYFKILPKVSTAILVRNPLSRVHEFLSENGVEAAAAAALLSATGLSELEAKLSPWRSRLIARQFLDLLDRLTLAHGHRIWVEKTPMHLHYVPFLETVSSPECRTYFVHVVREGLEVVASLHVASQKWERPYDLATCVRRWNNDVAISLSRVTCPADHFVFYEELTADPEGTLSRLFSALGLVWEPEVLLRFEETARDLTTAEETWKGSIGRGVRRSETAGRVLTSDERAEVVGSLRRQLYHRLREADR